MNEIIDFGKLTDNEIKSILQDVADGKIVIMIARKSGKATLFKRMKELLEAERGEET